MNNDTRWLVRFGRDHNLFTRRQALAVFEALGDGARLMDFAQKPVDKGMVHDIETLEKFAGLAHSTKHG